jgi:hypothetical protein
LTKLRQKRLTLARQLRLQLGRAIAIAAGPRLRPILVPAVSPGMRVFDTKKLEIFFPVGALFLQRRLAETGLHPGRHAGGIDARLLHVVLVCVAGDRPLTECLLLDRAKEWLLLAGFYPGFDEVTHGRENLPSPQRAVTRLIVLMIFSKRSRRIRIMIRSMGMNAEDEAQGI